MNIKNFLFCALLWVCDMVLIMSLLCQKSSIVVINYNYYYYCFYILSSPYFLVKIIKLFGLDFILKYLLYEISSQTLILEWSVAFGSFSGLLLNILLRLGHAWTPGSSDIRLALWPSGLSSCLWNRVCWVSVVLSIILCHKIHSLIKQGFIWSLIGSLEFDHHLALYWYVQCTSMHSLWMHWSVISLTLEVEI